MHSPKKGSQAVRAGWWRFCCFCHPSRLSSRTASGRRTHALSYPISPRPQSKTAVHMSRLSRLQRCADAFAIAPHAVQDRCLGPDACIHAFALTPSARDAPCHARTQIMMESCASAAKLRSGGPILPFGVRAKGRLGIPPPRTVIGVPSQAYGQVKTVVVPSTLRKRKAEGQNQLTPSTRAVEGFAGVWVTIRACGEVGFRLTAEAEIGRSRSPTGHRQCDRPRNVGLGGVEAAAPPCPWCRPARRS